MNVRSNCLGREGGALACVMSLTEITAALS